MTLCAQRTNTWERFGKEACIPECQHIGLVDWLRRARACLIRESLDGRAHKTRVNSESRRPLTCPAVRLTGSQPSLPGPVTGAKGTYRQEPAIRWAFQMGQIFSRSLLQHVEMKMSDLTARQVSWGWSQIAMGLRNRLTSKCSSNCCAGPRSLSNIEIEGDIGDRK